MPTDQFLPGVVTQRLNEGGRPDNVGEDEGSPGPLAGPRSGARVFAEQATGPPRVWQSAEAFESRLGGVQLQAGRLLVTLATVGLAECRARSGDLVRCAECMPQFRSVAQFRRACCRIAPSKQ